MVKLMVEDYDNARSVLDEDAHYELSLHHNTSTTSGSLYRIPGRKRN